MRFSKDGTRLLASSLNDLGINDGRYPLQNFFAVVDARTGNEVVFQNDPGGTHSTNPVCAQFSPDDRWVAAARLDHGIQLLDLNDGHLVVEMRGHTDRVVHLSFSGDGTLLASASLDRTVRLWRVPSGQPVGAPLQHRFPVVRVCLTDDGRKLVTGSFANPRVGYWDWSDGGEGEVQPWEVASGRRLGDPIHLVGAMVLFAAPSSLGTFYLSASHAGTRVFRFDPFGEAMRPLPLDPAQCWAFSRDGRRVALGGDASGESSAGVFDTTTGDLLSRPMWHNSWLNDIQFSPDESALLTASNDEMARLWDLRPGSTESSRRQLPGAMEDLGAGGFGVQIGRSPGRTPLFLANGLGLRLFDDDLRETHQLSRPDSGVRYRGLKPAMHSNLWASFRFEPDTRALVLHRPELPEPSRLMLEHPDEVLDAWFTAEDRLIVTTCRDGTVRYWRVDDGGLERQVSADNLLPGSFRDVSPDGTVAIRYTGEPGEQTFQFFDLAAARPIGDPRPVRGYIGGSAYSPDSSLVAMLHAVGPVMVMDPRSGRVVSTGIRHPGNTRRVEWAPDGRRLLTCGPNDEVLVWDAATGSQLFAPLRLPETISATEMRLARWSPDGRFIVTQNEETVRVWDSATGEPVTARLQHSGKVAFGFLTRSNRLITATLPDTLRAWDLTPSTLSPELLTDYARLVSGRRLDKASVMLPLPPPALAELHRSLRARLPALFR